MSPISLFSGFKLANCNHTCHKNSDRKTAAELFCDARWSSSIEPDDGILNKHRCCCLFALNNSWEKKQIRFGSDNFHFDKIIYGNHRIFDRNHEICICFFLSFSISLTIIAISDVLLIEKWGKTSKKKKKSRVRAKVTFECFIWFSFSSNQKCPGRTNDQSSLHINSHSITNPIELHILMWFQTVELWSCRWRTMRPCLISLLIAIWCVSTQG